MFAALAHPSISNKWTLDKFQVDCTIHSGEKAMIFQVGGQYHIRYNNVMRHIAVVETHYDMSNYMNSHIVAWDFTRNGYRSFTIGNITLANLAVQTSYKAIPSL